MLIFAMSREPEQVPFLKISSNFIKGSREYQYAMKKVPIHISIDKKDSTLTGKDRFRIKS
jgi:hypothetical protein